MELFHLERQDKARFGLLWIPQSKLAIQETGCIDVKHGMEP